MLSADAQARALFAWSEFWLNRSTPAVTSGPRTRIVIPVPSTDGETPSMAGWKQAPTAEERESMRDENWKKY